MPPFLPLMISSVALADMPSVIKPPLRLSRPLALMSRFLQADEFDPEDLLIDPGITTEAEGWLCTVPKFD